MMWPAVALLLLAGGALSAPTHALVPGDDGPPSVLRTNGAQHPRQHTAISALLPNDHERSKVAFFCKKTRYRVDGKRVGVFGGVWRVGQADQTDGVRFFKTLSNYRKKKDPSPWYVPEMIWTDSEKAPRGGVLFMDIPNGRGDYWKIEMDRMKYPRERDALQKAKAVKDILDNCRWRSRRAS